MADLTINDLFMIIGQKEAEILRLRKDMAEIRLQLMQKVEMATVRANGDGQG